MILYTKTKNTLFFVSYLGAFQLILILQLKDSSAFCDKSVQISSLYCSFTVFYSFLGGQLLTSLIANKKHMFFCVNV